MATDYLPTDTEIAVFINFLNNITKQQELHSPLTGVSGLKKSKLVVDALIGVCVSGARICLAMSVVFSPPNVKICIAQNTRKPIPDLVPYLQSIWTQLGAISESQKNLRKKHHLPDAFLNGYSPKSVVKQLKEAKPGSSETHDMRHMNVLKSKLAIDIHRFCFMKTKHRVKKYMQAFRNFEKYYARNKKRLDKNRRLAKVMFCLGEINDTVMDATAQGPLNKMGVPEGLDWKRLANFSSLLVNTYENNKDEITSCIWHVMAEWYGETGVKANNKLRQFDLSRAFMKMITLPTHIEELVRFAYSPRLRHMLSYNLSINCLDPLTSRDDSDDSGADAPSLSTTKRLITTAFSSTSFAGQEDILAAQLALATTTTTLPWPSSILVHAELTVLLHHHQEPRTTTRPFAYIAVSKLSCVCCWNFFKSYTRATSRAFLLRGSHAKLYFPWWPATKLLESQQLAARVRAGLWDTLVKLFDTHLKAEEAVRKSDSTVASGDGDGATGVVDIEGVDEIMEARNQMLMGDDKDEDSWLY